jgi:hypothetical protein
MSSVSPSLYHVVPSRAGRAPDALTKTMISVESYAYVRISLGGTRTLLTRALRHLSWFV